MSDVERFQPAGEMSQVDACLVVFLKLPPGEWVSLEDLLAQVNDLTGTVVSVETLRNAVWTAGERLPRSGRLGVDWYMGGYRRQDSVALAQAAEERLSRAIRDLGRLDTRTNAALKQPDLPAPWRRRMEHLHVNTVRQAALEAKRGNRRRPLPPGDAT